MAKTNVIMDAQRLNRSQAEWRGIANAIEILTIKSFVGHQCLLGCLLNTALTTVELN